MPHHIFSIKLEIRPILFMLYFFFGGGARLGMLEQGLRERTNLRGQLFNEL